MNTITCSSLTSIVVVVVVVVVVVDDDDDDDVVLLQTCFAYLKVLFSEYSKNCQ